MRPATALASAALASAALASAPAEARPAPVGELEIADDPPPPPPPPPPPRRPRLAADEEPRPPGSHKLGFRFGGGAAPLGAAEPALGLGTAGPERENMIGLALVVERPLGGRWRWLAEYELLWILPPNAAEAAEAPAMADAPAEPPAEAPAMDRAPAFDGSAHRVHAGLRRALISGRLGMLRMFVDLEAGAGATLALLPDATRFVPHAFAGVRLGYELFPKDGGAGAASSWEPALLFRVLGAPGGAGFLAGLSMTWGD